MAIRVAGNTTGASVSTVKPRASVTVVDPVASVAYAVPVAGVAYVQLAVDAYLDTTGRFKFIPETVVLVDGTAFVLEKPADDVVAVSDSSTLDVDKAVADAVAFGDVVETVLIFMREFFDSTAVSDAQAFSVAKALTESVATSDAYAISFSTSYADSVGVLEAAALSLAKAFTESLSLADSTVFDISKAVSEAVALADVTVLSVAKSVDDAQLVNDNQAFSTDKALADGFGLNEQFAFNYSLASTIDNVTFAGDAAVLNVDKTTTDSAVLADSGVLVVQDYCDITYFAEDYVGYATTF